MDINLGNLYYLVTQRGADEVENKLKKLETKFKSFGKGQNKASDPFTAINTGATKAENSFKTLLIEARKLSNEAGAVKNAFGAGLIDSSVAKAELNSLLAVTTQLRNTSSSFDLTPNIDKSLTGTIKGIVSEINKLDAAQDKASEAAKNLTSEYKQQQAEQAKLAANTKASADAQRAASKAIADAQRRLSQETKDAAASVRILRNDFQAGRISSEKLEAGVTQLSARMDLLRRNTNLTTQQTAQLATAQRSLTATSTAAAGGISRLGLASQVALGNSRALQTAFGGIAKAAVSGGVALAGFAAIDGVVRGFKSAVDISAEFEKSMQRVIAVTGTALGSFGSQQEALSALTEEARRLGGTTEFTASEAASALAFLGQAGFSASQQLAALEATLNLASAGQLELGRSADIASNILSQYNLTAEETGRVADVLAKTATSSNTNIEQLAEAFNFLGPTANALNVSLEESAAIIGILGNSGLQGSLATRALGTSLIRLADPTKKALGVIEEIGLEAFDLNGEFVGLAALVEQLEEGFEGYTDEAKQAALSTIFGKEAIQELNILLTAGSGELREFTGELEKSGGSAQTLADTQLEGLKGAQKELNSAWQESSIILGSVFLPILEVLTDLLTNTLQEFNNLSSTTSNLGSSFINLVNGTTESKTALEEVNAASLVTKQGISELIDVTDEKGLTGAVDTLARTLNEEGQAALRDFAAQTITPILQQGEFQKSITETIKKIDELATADLRSERAVLAAQRRSLLQQTTQQTSNISDISSRLNVGNAPLAPALGANPRELAAYNRELQLYNQKVQIASNVTADLKASNLSLGAEVIESTKAIQAIDAQIEELSILTGIATDETKSWEQRQAELQSQLNLTGEVVGSVVTATNDLTTSNSTIVTSSTAATTALKTQTDAIETLDEKLKRLQASRDAQVTAINNRRNDPNSFLGLNNVFGDNGSTEISKQVQDYIDNRQEDIANANKAKAELEELLANFDKDIASNSSNLSSVSAIQVLDPNDLEKIQQDSAKQFQKLIEDAKKNISTLNSEYADLTDEAQKQRSLEYQAALDSENEFIIEALRQQGLANTIVTSEYYKEQAEKTKEESKKITEAIESTFAPYKEAREELDKQIEKLNDELGIDLFGLSTFNLSAQVTEFKNEAAKEYENLVDAISDEIDDLETAFDNKIAELEASDALTINPNAINEATDLYIIEYQALSARLTQVQGLAAQKRIQASKENEKAVGDAIIADYNASIARVAEATQKANVLLEENNETSAQLAEDLFRLGLSPEKLAELSAVESVTSAYDSIIANLETENTRLETYITENTQNLNAETIANIQAVIASNQTLITETTAASSIAAQKALSDLYDGLFAQSLESSVAFDENLFARDLLDVDGLEASYQQLINFYSDIVSNTESTAEQVQAARLKLFDLGDKVNDLRSGDLIPNGQNVLKEIFNGSDLDGQIESIPNEQLDKILGFEALEESFEKQKKLVTDFVSFAAQAFDAGDVNADANIASIDRQINPLTDSLADLRSEFLNNPTDLLFAEISNTQSLIDELNQAKSVYQEIIDLGIESELNSRQVIAAQQQKALDTQQVNVSGLNNSSGSSDALTLSERIQADINELAQARKLLIDARIAAQGSQDPNSFLGLNNVLGENRTTEPQTTDEYIAERQKEIEDELSELERLEELRLRGLSAINSARLSANSIFEPNSFIGLNNLLGQNGQGGLSQGATEYLSNRKEEIENEIAEGLRLEELRLEGLQAINLARLSAGSIFEPNSFLGLNNVLGQNGNSGISADGQAYLDNRQQEIDNELLEAERLEKLRLEGLAAINSGRQAANSNQEPSSFFALNNVFGQNSSNDTDSQIRDFTSKLDSELSSIQNSFNIFGGDDNDRIAQQGEAIKSLIATLGDEGFTKQGEVLQGLIERYESVTGETFDLIGIDKFLADGTSALNGALPIINNIGTAIGGLETLGGAIFGDDATGNGNEILSGISQIASAFGPFGQAVSGVIDSINSSIGNLGNGLREIELEVRDLATGFSFFSEEDIAEALKPAQERISRGGFLGFLGFTKAGLNETEKNLILDNLREIEGVIQGAVDSLDLSSIIPDINAIVGKSLIDGVIESSQIGTLSQQYQAALLASNEVLAADLEQKLNAEIARVQPQLDEIAATYSEPILDGTLSNALGGADNFKDFKDNYKQSIVDSTKAGLVEALQATAAFQIIEADMKDAIKAAVADGVVSKDELAGIQDIQQRGLDAIENSGIFDSFDLLDRSIGKTNEAFDELTATVINGPANFDLNNYVDPFYASRPQSSSRTENYNITVDGRTLTRAEIVDIVRESNNQTARRDGSGINPVY